MQTHSLIDVRQITMKDSELFDKAVELLNRTQGEGIFPPNYLELKTRSPLAYVIGAFEKGHLLGLGVAEIINSFEFYIPFDGNLPAELQGRKVGSFSTLAVVEGRQGQGIGQKISAKRLEWLKEQGCTTVLGVSWESGREHTSNRVFEKMGFQAIKKVDHFFKQMSIERNFHCPGCKVFPCTCAGILYRWPKK